MLADVKNGGFSAEIEKYTAANSNFSTRAELHFVKPYSFERGRNNQSI